MKKSEYRLIDRVNKKMLSWRGEADKPYIVEEAETMLLNWYDKYDIAMRKGQQNITFTKSKKISGEALQELVDIATMVDQAETAGKGYYRNLGMDEVADMSEKVKKVYQGHKTLRPDLIQKPGDIVKNLKKMENLSPQIREAFSSAQLFDIYDYGYAYGLTNKQIYGVLSRQSKKEYQEDGKRYEAVLGRLDEMYKRKQSKEKGLYQ